MFVELETRARVAEELEPGEQLLWSGRPDYQRWFYPLDVLLVSFSVLWGGFAIFWETLALSSHTARDSVIFPLWGIPFVVMGLYLMVGRFFVRRWRRRRTIYALSDQRAFAITPAWPRGERVTSVWLGSYPPVDQRLMSKGRGTLWIGSVPGPQKWLAGDYGWPGAQRAAGNAVIFSDIPDAAEVYARIRRQLTEGSARASRTPW
jgi:hypothetical protein